MVKGQGSLVISACTMEPIQMERYLYQYEKVRNLRFQRICPMTIDP
ncbi:hypothetical protein [Rubritalea tangerina]